VLFVAKRELCQDAQAKLLQRSFLQAGPYDCTACFNLLPSQQPHAAAGNAAWLPHAKYRSISLLYCLIMSLSVCARFIPHPTANRERCQEAQAKFLKRCFYQAGPYDTPEGFQALSSRLDELESHKPQANRMFFLSIPPNVFLPATGNAADYARSK
jgi:hypothetical protein